MHWLKKENKILLVKLTNCEFYHDETVSQMHSAAQNPFLCRLCLGIFDEPLDRWISWYSGSVNQTKEMSKPHSSLMIFINEPSHEIMALFVLRKVILQWG